MGTLHPVDRSQLQVVLEVLTDARQVMHHGNIQFLQQFALADAEEALNNRESNIDYAAAQAELAVASALVWLSGSTYAKGWDDVQFALILFALFIWPES